MSDKLYLWEGGVEKPLKFEGMTFGGFMLPLKLEKAFDSSNVGSTEAAVLYDWGTPVGGDEFNGGSLGSDWTAYSGFGYQGQGTFDPDNVFLTGNTLDILGDPNGNSGGIISTSSRQYGRWEARLRVLMGTPNYHPVLMLWPASGDWPDDGQIEWLETNGDGGPQNVRFRLHYGPTDFIQQSSQSVDIGQYHNYAVEWTPTEIRGYIDGAQSFIATDTSRFPPGPMRMAIRLDWYGNTDGAAWIKVDWIRVYN
ncbi:glycoside hydrolase family 16 protein [Candidatus Saccharibacteria bacterium]|nr:glycoside hydrolase family 16 protein [Candidatus Saccharibacteria bacterium]